MGRASPHRGHERARNYRTSGDQSRGTIAGEGAIDVLNVREAIERIMVGGKAAFNLRREKYGF
jgi:chromosome segregation protein